MAQIWSEQVIPQAMERMRMLLAGIELGPVEMKLLAKAAHWSGPVMVPARVRMLVVAGKGLGATNWKSWPGNCEATPLLKKMLNMLANLLPSLSLGLGSPVGERLKGLLLVKSLKAEMKTVQEGGGEGEGGGGEGGEGGEGGDGGGRGEGGGGEGGRGLGGGGGEGGGGGLGGGEGGRAQPGLCTLVMEHLTQGRKSMVGCPGATPVG